MFGLVRAARRHRAVLVDALVAGFVVAVAGALALHLGGPGEPVAGPLWVRVVFALGISLPLLVRRRWPLLTATVVWLAIALQGLVSHESDEGLHLIVVFGVVAYSTAVFAPRREAVYALVPQAAGFAAYAWTNADFQSGRSADRWAIAFFGVYTGAMWLAGLAVRARRDGLLAARATAELEEQSAAAVAAERARLARELHDVVAHKLSVVVVQAAGARAQVSTDPASRDEALSTIETSGREALVEMRRMLEVLRSGEETTDLSTWPAIADLPALVDDVRRTGLDVRLHVGELTGLPQVTELAVFRIVQEALTNTLKHADARTVEVDVSRHADEIEVRVRDDGTRAPDLARPGHGLIGMRERVQLLGGRLSATRASGGGFEVCAWLPAGDQA